LAHMYSHHMHNEHKTVENLISRLKREKTSFDFRCGNASDIRSWFSLTCLRWKRVEVECLPGATAFVPFSQQWF
jgi:16S rRNA (cytidine1402-2'-O)-methyltransferase